MKSSAYRLSTSRKRHRKWPQPEGTHKLASPCTSDPATTLPFHKNLPMCHSAVTKSPAKCDALCGVDPPGARGQWKGYVLAEDCPPTGKGKLPLLDAPPALLPQRSTRSGKVFKPPEVEVALTRRLGMMTVRKRGGSIEDAGREELQGNALF
jgi:hypothetical protein